MDLLAPHDVQLVMADNPSMFTLTGTNTWLVGRDPCWIVDPGPELPAHQEAVAAAAAQRGGAAGVVLTHDHSDHAGGVPALLGLLDPAVVVAAARYPGTAAIGDGDSIGPFTALATPGHASDHLTFLTAGAIAFTGDHVLGKGSVFVWPDPGALRAYLAGLQRLRDLAPALICPAHGPLVDDPLGKIDEYVAHRRERERRLVEALQEGRRSVEELLDAAWSEVPEHLRIPAAWTMASHLDKLDEEGRLPQGVERPALRL